MTVNRSDTPATGIADPVLFPLPIRSKWAAGLLHVGLVFAFRWHGVRSARTGMTNGIRTRTRCQRTTGDTTYRPSACRAERFATLDPDPPLSLLAAQEEVQEGVPLERVHYELREVVSARPPTGMSGGGLSVVCESFRSPAGCCCRAVAEQLLE